MDRLRLATRTGFGTYALSTPTPEMSSTNGPDPLTTRQYLSDQRQPSHVQQAEPLLAKSAQGAPCRPWRGLTASAGLLKSAEIGLVGVSSGCQPLGGRFASPRLLWTRSRLRKRSLVYVRACLRHTERCPFREDEGGLTACSNLRQDVWPCTANTWSASVKALTGWLSSETSAAALLDGSKQGGRGSGVNSAPKARRVQQGRVVKAPTRLSTRANRA
jgi:hypothetical protein